MLKILCSVYFTMIEKKKISCYVTDTHQRFRHDIMTSDIAFCGLFLGATLRGAGGSISSELGSTG